MVRKAILFLAAGLCCSANGAAPPADSVRSPADSVEFTCAEIPLSEGDEPGATEVSWKADTIRFTLFYVDAACQGYSYVFQCRKQLLKITRVRSPQGTCDRTSERLYGLTGNFRRVPPGVYRLQLWSLDGKKSEKLSEDLVESKKPLAAPAAVDSSKQ
jgi:hypothetical protein